MERLWAPWRMAYIRQCCEPGCFLCDAFQSEADAENLIVKRGEACAVILNRYPYNNGHLMVAPCRHVATLGELTGEERRALLDMACLGEQLLQAVVNPDGFNMGINQGSAAGAGLTWLALRYARRRGLLDEPGERRSHSVATPRGGGISITLVVLATIFALGWAHPQLRLVLQAGAVGLVLVATVARLVTAAATSRASSPTINDSQMSNGAGSSTSSTQKRALAAGGHALTYARSSTRLSTRPAPASRGASRCSAYSPPR